MSRHSALANVNYRNYFIASCFGTMGVWMTRFLFSWLIWETTESPLWIGLASGSLLLPSLIITPIFGVISDRINLKHGVIVWFCGQATITGLTFIIFSIFGRSLGIMVLMTFIFGCISAAGSPLRLNLLPQLVGKEQLANAVGMSAMLFNSSRIGGPAVIAVCLTLINATWAFCLCTLMFIIAAAMASRLPSFKKAKPKQASNGWADFVSGAVHCWQQPVIRLMFLITFANTQVARSFIELLPALSGTFTQGRSADLAALTACAGVGSILGGWFISQQKGAEQRLMLILTLAMFAISTTLVPLLFSPPVWLLGLLVGGISLLMTVLGTGMQIMLQLVCDESKRGRVMSLWITITLVGPAFGAFFMGSIAEFFGFTAMLLVMLIFSIISALLLKFSSQAKTLMNLNR